MQQGSSLEEPLQQDGQEQSHHSLWDTPLNQEKGVLRLVVHSYNKSPAGVATDVNILNLNSHRSLNLL